MLQLSKWIFYIASCSFILYLFYINMYRCGFWELKISDLITIVIACLISYYLKDRKEDTIRRNDCIEHIITEIEQMLESDDLFSIERRIALSKQRSCANRVKYLKKASFDGLSDDINFIETHIDIIREIYSDNEQQQEEYLKKYQNLKGLIVDRCVKIRISLYPGFSKK